MDDPHRRFWFRLARELGMSLKRCQDEIDSAEFAEWIAECQIEPFGEIRDDLRAGIIASTVANFSVGEGSFSARDFMPEFGHDDDEPEQVTVEDKVERVFQGLGGLKWQQSAT